MQTAPVQPHATRDQTLWWFPWATGLLVLLPYMPLLSPDDRVFDVNEYCDYVTYYIPVREFAREEMLEGRFPLWIPWLCCGLPLHATTHVTVCYPLLTPLLFAFQANQATRISLFVHLCLCFVGQYLLTRSVGASRAAASFAATVPTQCSYAVCHLMMGHVNHMLSFGLMPWVLLALIRHLRYATAGSALFLVSTGTLLIFSGHPQPPYYVTLIGGLWAIASLINGEGARHRLRCIAWGAAAIITSVLLGAIQILPTLELTQDAVAASGRGTQEFAGAFSLDAFDLLHFFVPNLRGNPFVGIPDFSSYYFFHERSGYVGLTTLMFSFYALWKSPLRQREWGIAALIVLSLIIALGNSTPLFGILGRVFPGLHLFRCPGRILSVFSILAGLLAGRGLDFAVHKETSNNQQYSIVLGGLVFATLNALAYLMMSELERFSWSGYGQFIRLYLVDDFVLTTTCALAAVVVFWACLHFGSVAPTLVCCGALIALLIDLWLCNISNFRLDAPNVETIPQRMLEIDPPLRYVDVRPSGHLTAEDIRYCKSLPMAIASHRSLLGTNDGGLLPAATVRLFRGIEANQHTALEVSSCSFLYHPDTNNWESTGRGTRRCRFIPEQQVNVELISIEFLKPGDLSQGNPPLDPPVRILHETSQEITVQCDAMESGTLVIADTAYPGWRCTVDDVNARVETVHGVFRGVKLSSGTHRVKFYYQPDSFILGCQLSILGLGAFSLLGVIAICQRRRKTTGA